AVVADPRHVVLLPRHRLQVLGDVAQGLVAEAVAVRGVEAGEPVQVHHHQPEQRLSLIAEADLLAQQRQEAAAVVQPGQLVFGGGHRRSVSPGTARPDPARTSRTAGPAGSPGARPPRLVRSWPGPPRGTAAAAPCRARAAASPAAAGA